MDLVEITYLRRCDCQQLKLCSYFADLNFLLNNNLHQQTNYISELLTSLHINLCVHLKTTK